MAEFRISDDADRDLDAIFDHSVAHWGIDRATGYLAMFDDQFTRLAEFPMLGTLRPDVGEAIRNLSLGSHIVYFTSDNTVVTIARVLRQRMIPTRHL